MPTSLLAHELLIYECVNTWSTERNKVKEEDLSSFVSKERQKHAALCHAYDNPCDAAYAGCHEYCDDSLRTSKLNKGCHSACDSGYMLCDVACLPETTQCKIPCIAAYNKCTAPCDTDACRESCETALSACLAPCYATRRACKVFLCRHSFRLECKAPNKASKVFQ